MKLHYVVMTLHYDLKFVLQAKFTYFSSSQFAVGHYVFKLWLVESLKRFSDENHKRFNFFVSFFCFPD